MTDESQSRGDDAEERILFVLPWELRAIGGVDNVVANLYEQFAAHGPWKPLLLIQSWSDRTPTFSNENGHQKIRVRLRSLFDDKRPVRALLMYLVCLPHEVRKVASIVRTHHIAVVNAHYPTPSILSVALARRLGLAKAKLVLSLHGTDIRMAAAGGIVQKMLWRWLLRQADSVVAVSEGLARVAVDFEPRIRSRLSVVHNGIDADRFVVGATKADSLLPDLEGQRVVLSVGAFEHKKGHDVLLKAFLGLSNRHKDLHLVLIGQAGPETAQVESAVEELGLAERCTVLKDVPHEVVARYMRAASLFVLASRSEPFGLVLLEAGAFGLPVVATRVGGIPEIIAGPEYGVLVEPDDPRALGRALEELLQNAEGARVLGENLRQRVRAVFSWEAAYRKYRDILEDGREPGAAECELNRRAGR